MKAIKKLLACVLCFIMVFQLGISVLGAGESEFIPIVGIVLDNVELTMYYGTTAKLTAAAVPSNASDTGITWSSSNEALVHVDGEGNLTAAEDTAESPSGAQKVTITATSTFDKSVKATCVVTVDNEPESKVIAALKKVFDLIKGALPTVIEYAKTNLKPLLETIINFVKELFSKISAA